MLPIGELSENSCTGFPILLADYNVGGLGSELAAVHIQHSGNTTMFCCAYSQCK